MTASADQVLAALADGSRRTIIQRLAATSAATPTELAAGLPITRQAVSKHLHILEEAQLVTANRQGRETRYTLRPLALESATDWIAGVTRTWETRLDRLKRQVETRATEGADG